jgi:glutathione peroxidase
MEKKHICATHTCTHRKERSWRSVGEEKICTGAPWVSSPFLHALCLLIQENCQNEEILNSLKYVRPGGGYQPTFSLTQKCDVNGQNEHPVFAYLKDKLPYPYDDPFSLMTDPKLIIWSPVRRSDVSWNFEKFLIGPEGEPFRRYSRSFQTINIEPDIKRLLKVAI